MYGFDSSRIVHSFSVSAYARKTEGKYGKIKKKHEAFSSSAVHGDRILFHDHGHGFS
jgi:hypothetical protein